MSYDDEPEFGEPFGADYEAPRSADCPNCGCCTARLCETATGGGVHCTVRSVGDDVLVVSQCPCTEELPGSGPALLESAYFKELQARRSE